MLKLLAMKGTGKLAALPLSYINRFFTEAARTSKQKEQSMDTMTAPEQQVKKKRCTPPKLAIPSLDHSDSLEGGEDDGKVLRITVGNERSFVCGNAHVILITSYQGTNPRRMTSSQFCWF